MTRSLGGALGSPPAVRIRRLLTDALSPSEIAAIRALLDAAFWDEEDERFTEEDWQHSIGGIHVVLDVDGEIAAHASVVERELQVAGRPFRTGYVEAVATAPAHQRRGYGTQVMQAIDAEIRAVYELGALGTGEIAFYERLGWRVWRGPTSVRTRVGERRTPDEDGGIMVLLVPLTPAIELDAPISCEWRPGDVW
jgi:aminoglycoside 2'-N-acetyltransferase I